MNYNILATTIELTVLDYASRIASYVQNSSHWKNKTKRNADR